MFLFRQCYALYFRPRSKISNLTSFSLATDPKISQSFVPSWQQHIPLNLSTNPTANSVAVPFPCFYQSMLSLLDLYPQIVSLDGIIPAPLDQLVSEQSRLSAAFNSCPLLHFPSVTIAIIHYSSHPGLITSSRRHLPSFFF